MDAGFSPRIRKHELNPSELAEMVRAAIGEGYAISFEAPGTSMLPFIRSGDKIFVFPVVAARIRVGDVLVFVHPESGHVLAHRAVKTTSSRILCKGDNVAEHSDGWIFYADVLGKVAKVQRKGKTVWFGQGHEKKLIAYLSRKKRLVPLMNALRRVKQTLVGRFSSKG